VNAAPTVANASPTAAKGPARERGALLHGGEQWPRDAARTMLKILCMTALRESPYTSGLVVSNDLWREPRRLW